MTDPTAEAVLASMRAFNETGDTDNALWRAVVAYADWHIPTTEDSRALMWEINGRNYIAAQIDQASMPDTVHWQTVRGRWLVRHIPSDADGIAFELGTPHAMGITKADQGDLLEHWARVIDVEMAMALPSPYDANRFLDLKWLVLGTDGRASVTWCGNLLVVNGFTEYEALEYFRERDLTVSAMDVYGMPGRDLFGQLAARDDFDGVVVNHMHETWEPLSPNFVANILLGNDTRPNTGAVLRARSIAEIHAFLDQRGMSTKRTHAMQYRDDELVAHYEGELNGDIVGFDFEPIVPLDDPLNFGPGASELLCGGLLFQSLRRFVAQLPGTRVEFNAMRLRGQAVQADRWVRELEKMIPDGADSLPRTMLRTAEGARVVRELGEPITPRLLQQIRAELRTLIEG
jgi:hypothetical protein